MGQPEKLPRYAEEAIATGTTNPKALVAAYELSLERDLKQRDRTKADAHYAKAAALQPGNPWVRGNYARNVIMKFGDFDTGERPGSAPARAAKQPRGSWPAPPASPPSP